MVILLPVMRRYYENRSSITVVLCSFTTHCSLRLIVRSELDVPTFATRCLHACHQARAPSGGRWNCGREMFREFCLNVDFYVIFRELLHAVKLWHGTDGFTSPPKKGVLRIFLRPKNPTASAGYKPRELGKRVLIFSTNFVWKVFVLGRI